jgi:tetratricopeptide (TPR) repeat protein
VGAPSESEVTAERRAAFVGREREMSLLAQTLGEVGGGEGRVVLVTGEPGIGKTRIGEELARLARERGFEVRWGHCHETGGAPAYWPWLQIIRAQVEESDEAEVAQDFAGAARGVLELGPEPRSLPGVALEPTPAAERFRLFDGVTTWLRHRARRRPLMLLLDDLHLADEPSLHLLAFVAREMADARLLVMATYRDDEIAAAILVPASPVSVPASSAERPADSARILAGVAREHVTRRVALRGLGEPDVARLIELVSGVRPADELAAAVHRETDGNPLFVGEVARLLADEGALAPRGPARVFISLPQGVREVLSRRMERLSTSCRELLTAASVIGREVSLPVVERLLGWERALLLECFDEAERARLVKQIPSSQGRYLFAHGLLREALYADLGVSRRAALHQRVGEIIAELHSDAREHLAELAHHFALAAPLAGPERAVEYSIRAGDQATALWAYEDAVAHYRRARDLVDLEGAGVMAEGARAELLVALGNAEMRCGDVGAARRTYGHAADLARRRGDAALLARVALGLGQGWLWGVGAGMADDLVCALLEESLTAIGDSDETLRSLLLGRLALAHYWSVAQSGEDAVTLAAEAVAVARRVGDPKVELMALASRQWVAWDPADAAERLDEAGVFVALAERLGDRAMELLGHAFRLVRFLELGEIRGADREIDRYADLSEELRLPSVLWYGRAFRAMRAILDGDFVAAEELSLQALAIGQRAGSDMAVQAVGVLFFAIRREQGRLREIQEQVREVAERFGTPRALGAPVWRCALALLSVDLGQYGDARRCFEDLARESFADLPHDANRLTALSALARICAALEDDPRARLLYDLLRPYEGRYVVAAFGILCEGSVASYLGLLAATGTRWDDAERHFVDGLAANARLGSRPLVAWTQQAYAAMLLRRGRSGDGEKARHLLDSALETASSLGMQGLGGSIRLMRDERSAELREVTANEATAGARASTAPPVERGNQFRREGEYWTLAFAGRVSRMRDSKGLRYIAFLLAEPGREFHVVDLIGRGSSGAGDVVAAEIDPTPLAPSGGIGPLLDESARAAYQRRIEEAREELADAESCHDPGRAARASEEIAFISEQLARAVGLGGRSREVGSHTERARLMVTQRVKAALKKIDSSDPVLGRHLAGHIRTGAFCSYVPDPDHPVEWQL